MQKEYKGPERRKFKRVMFTPDRMIEGAVVFESVDREFSFKIADISQGGLRFMMKRNDVSNIGKGDQLFLRRIQGQLELNFEEPLELEIRWIMDEAAFQFVMIGCEFKKLHPAASDQIERLVNTELERLAGHG